MINPTAQKLLEYWFGRAEQTVNPSTRRWRIWFAKDKAVDEEIKQHYEEVLEQAIRGDCEAWVESPRGRLALIILLDQFSRVIYRDLGSAFAQDDKALKLCLEGIEKQDDHALSLIERVFFYMPLMHAESTEMQTLSVRAYQMLTALSFQESRETFEKFLAYAIRHYDVVDKFGRFPQRNMLLGRPSTNEELEFLKNPSNLF